MAFETYLAIQTNNALKITHNENIAIIAEKQQKIPEMRFYSICATKVKCSERLSKSIRGEFLEFLKCYPGVACVTPELHVLFRSYMCYSGVTCAAIAEKVE